MPDATSTLIYNQLGGKAFAARTGAYSFASAPNFLSFRLPSHKANLGIGGVKITLDESDTYKVEFIALREINGILTAVAINTQDHIYCDDLAETIQKITGL